MKQISLKRKGKGSKKAISISNNNNALSQNKDNGRPVDIKTMTKYISEKHEQTRSALELSTDDIYEHIKQTFDKEPSKEQVEEIYNNFGLFNIMMMDGFWNIIEHEYEEN